MKPSTKGKQHPAFGILLSLLLALAVQTSAQSDSSPPGPAQGDGGGRGRGDRAADEESGRKGGGSRQPIQTSKCNDVPAHPFDLILGRPTPNSVTISVLCYEDTEGGLAYGTQRGKPASSTPTRLFKKGEPVEIVLRALEPNTQYYYQFRSARTNSEEFTFHTTRPPGSTFTFTITADSHLDEHTDPVIYQRTLANALADAPDFHIDLGDTFMTEKHPNREAAAKQYVAQRYYFGQLCDSVPLFLVLGNHDGESPRGRGSDYRQPRRLVQPDAQALFPQSRSRQLFHRQCDEAPRSGSPAGLLCLGVGRRFVRRAGPILVYAEATWPERQLETHAGCRAVSVAQTHTRSEQSEVQIRLHPSSGRRRG